MDVRAKQRLCYHVVRLTLAGLVAVSPHVISAVGRLSVKSDEVVYEKFKLEIWNYSADIFRWHNFGFDVDYA